MLKGKCLNVYNVGIAIAILVFSVLVLSGIAAAQRNITSCTTIIDRGEYVLTRDINTENTCIRITTSDVIFDGNGFTIDGYSSSNGVFISNPTVSISNVTIKNLTVTNYNYGIYLGTTSDSNLINITALNNNYGIYLNNSFRNNINGNNASDNGGDSYGYGIYLVSSNNNTLNKNTANLNNANYGNSSGIYLESSNNNTLYENIANWNHASGNGYGIYLRYSNDNNLSSNTANSNEDSQTGSGIFLEYSHKNTLNRNNASLNDDNGIYLYSSNDNNLSSNTASSNQANFLPSSTPTPTPIADGHGIHLIASSNNTLTSNKVSSNDNTGIYLSSSGNNKLSGNNVSNNGVDFTSSSLIHGIYLSYSSNNTINGNNASNNLGDGIYLFSSKDNKLSENNASNDNGDGIYMSSSDNNMLESNIANSNNARGEDYYSGEHDGYGIRLSTSSNNTLTGNNASNNKNNGFTLESSSNNNLSDNIITSNLDTGIYLFNSSDNIFNGNNASKNYYSGFFSASGSINNEILDLNINQTISFKGKDVAINSSIAAPSDPQGSVYHNIGKYVGVSNTSADSWIFLNMSYDHTDLSTLNESTLRMWEYNGDSWSQVSGINDVNKENNYVYANITSFSIFAPMGIDNIPPVTSIISPQNITYPKAVIPLNVSADQEVQNWLYSLNGGNNTSFVPNATIVASKGANTLIVYANDSAGNWNSSTVNFSVDLTWPVNISILSPENNFINKTGNVSVMVSLDTLVDTVILNWDGINESNFMESIPNDEGKILYKGNKTGLFSGNFSFRVYARDLNGNFNVSETRIVEIDRSTIFDFSDYIDNGTIIKDLVIPVVNDTIIPIPSSLIIFHNTKVTFNCINNNTFKRNRLQKLDRSINLLVDYNFGGENITFEPICDPEIPDPQTRFIPDAQIRFNYTHEQLRKLGIEDRENELTVQYYNSSKNIWEDVEPEMKITRDTVLNIITVNTSHLTVFALAVPAVAIGSAGTSGGGERVGGGGVITKEPFDNIEKFETETKNINDYSSSAYRYSFQYGIYEIIVNGKNVINDVSIRVELLKGLSRLVREPAPEIVHFYQNIWSGTNDVKDVLIRFREENSWIASQNISNVKMYKWDGSKWIDLEAKEISKDNTYTYFEVRSDGFSNFAVIGEKAALAQEQITPTPNITPERETAEGISPTSTPASGPTVSWNYILIVLALILGLIIIVLGVSGAKPIKSISSEKFVVTSQEAYGAKYYEYLLEQYKLYVITADKLRERQQYINNYFLIFNSIFVTIFGVLFGFASINAHYLWQYLLLFAGFLVSITWGTLSSHNRQFNSVKLALIHEIESKLPMELHYSENRIMEENKENPYLNYSLLEEYVPWIFTGIYILLIVMVLSGLI